MDTERKSDITNILILTTVALVIGVYLIATSILISEDGVKYIDLAQRFPSEPLKVINVLPPGYPFLVFAAHKLVSIFGIPSSASAWIYSAQSVSLLCRILVLIPLYFFGKHLVGSNKSFWAVLILLILPYPASYGSDTLRDWPHMLFLMAGMLLLLRGTEGGKCWMFAGAGVAAALGHMIRSEGAQLVVYGVLLILVRIASAKREFNRRTLVGALAALLLGFAIPAAPYMAMRDRIVPEKLGYYIGVSTTWESDLNHEAATSDYSSVLRADSAGPGKTAKAIEKLAANMSDNLMHYFVPVLLVGFYARIRRRASARDTEKFLIPAFVFCNILMTIMLYYHWGYISRRHCLPLTAILIFYVPVGLEVLAQWFDSRFSGSQERRDTSAQRWFFVILAVGICICTPKLLTPLGASKQGYREAAEWLKQNSNPEDVIAVPDSRISFYAEREGVMYSTEIPETTDYIVKIAEDENERLLLEGRWRKEFSVRLDKRKKNKKQIIIYRMT